MKRDKRYTAGEIRLRVSSSDLERLQWLLDNATISYPTHTISALIRTLILREYERLQPKTAH